MTMPFGFGAPAAPPGGQPGPRNARGELVMQGGYDQAIAQANGGQHPGNSQQMVPGLNPFMQQAPVQQQQQQPMWQQPVQQQQQPVWQAPQMPVFNPPPQNGLPVDGLPSPIQNQPWPIRQQPVQQPAWQQQFNQPVQQQFQPQQLPPGVDLNQRLSGPGIPPELQNRTLGELVGIHNGLRQIHLNQLAGGQQQQAIPPLSQQQAPVQQQQQTQQSAAWDWRDPAGSTRRVVTEAVAEVVQNQLAPALAPIQHQAMVGQITQARDRARMQFGDQYFAQLEPIINQSLAGIDPRALLNPQTWIVAAERALGQVARQGQMPMQPQQQIGVAQQQPNGAWGMQQPQGPGAYPLQIVQPGVQPLPNLNTFFSEAPGQGGPGSPGNFQLTGEQSNAARLMGIPEATYAAWAGGMQQQPGGRR